MRTILTQTFVALASASALVIATGCHTERENSVQSSQSPAPVGMQTTTPSSVAAVGVTPPPATSQGIIRIDAGSTSPVKDSSGNIWEAERGFDGGDVVERDSNTAISNTKDPALFRSEHYSMNSFSCNVPNGKYIAKLYFAETFEGISGPGERVFSFSVQGHEFKDFDVFAKAGGANRAYVETVPVEVKDGKFQITFTSKVENPEINAIELDPGN